MFVCLFVMFILFVYLFITCVCSWKQSLFIIWLVPFVHPFNSSLWLFQFHFFVLCLFVVFVCNWKQCWFIIWLVLFLDPHFESSPWLVLLTIFFFKSMKNLWYISMVILSSLGKRKEKIWILTIWAFVNMGK